MKHKIIILATYVGVINRGGETFVVELVKKLREYYDIEVYSMGINEDIKEQMRQVSITFPKFLKYHEIMYNKCRVYRKICDLTYYFIPMVIEQYFFSRKVYKEHLQKRDDISLIFPVNGIHGMAIAKIIREERKVPYIYAGHGGIGKGEEIILKSNPNCYMPLTPSAYNWAKQYSKNLKLIPNGVNVKDFSRESPMDKNSLNVLCVGAFTAFKRQKLLIDSMQILGYGNLTLLGSGELQEDLKAYGEKKLGERFKILSVAYSEIKSYYEEANIFSLPSLNEPFGIVYVEAMSMNIPVVGPNDEARKYIVGDCGVLCDVENPKEYAKAIEQCFLTNYEDKPRKRAEEFFSWDMVGLQYKEIIDTLIKERR